MPNVGSKKTMSSAAHIIETTRRATAALVEREERRVGSRMVAYEIVASTVGASSSWIRKFVGRCPSLKPDLVIGFNIVRAYETLCTRVEQELENERSRAAALRVELHEAFPGLMEFVESEIRDVETTAASEPPP